MEVDVEFPFRQSKRKKIEEKPQPNAERHELLFTDKDGDTCIDMKRL